MRQGAGSPEHQPLPPLGSVPWDPEGPRKMRLGAVTQVKVDALIHHGSPLCACEYSVRQGPSWHQEGQAGSPRMLSGRLCRGDACMGLSGWARRSPCFWGWGSMGRHALGP